MNTMIKIVKSFFKILKSFIKNFINKETPKINKNKLSSSQAWRKEKKYEYY